MTSSLPANPQHMKDKFWNFIFYKFIFVFGIVNVQYLHEIVLWVSWFSALGFLHLMQQLCKDRFEYVSSPGCPGLKSREPQRAQSESQSSFFSPTFNFNKIKIISSMVECKVDSAQPLPRIASMLAARLVKSKEAGNRLRQ
jgi:hypothetical protein